MRVSGYLDSMFREVPSGFAPRIELSCRNHTLKDRGYFKRFGDSGPDKQGDTSPAPTKFLQRRPVVEVRTLIPDAIWAKLSMAIK